MRPLQVVAHAQAKATKAKEAEKKEALVKAKAKASKAKANALKKGVVAEALKVCPTPCTPTCRNSILDPACACIISKQTSSKNP